MYSQKRYLVGVDAIANAIGIGRNKCLFLCQTRPNSFPVVRVGNRYQADKELLEQWRLDWYTGEFDIDFRKE